MAAMPFSFNDILVVVGNLPRIFPMPYLIYASFPIPYINLFIFTGNGPALCFIISPMVISHDVQFTIELLFCLYVPIWPFAMALNLLYSSGRDPFSISALLF